MKRDSDGVRVVWTAELDVEMVRFSKEEGFEIDFPNQIDEWSKMEFTFRHQISKLKAGKPRKRRKLQNLDTLVYAVRETLD